MSDSWYSDFFHGLANELWRRVTPPEQTAGEVEWLSRELKLDDSRSRLLDVPSGAGRHALALAERGHEVHGVDISPEFLAEARANALDKGVEVDYREGDMRDLPADGSFDAAYTFGNSFGYLPHEGMQEFVAAVSASLRPGARYAFDTGMAAESIIPNLEEVDQYVLGDLTMSLLNRYDVEAGVLESKMRFTLGDQVETRAMTHTVYTVAELQRLLAEAGLETVALHRDVEGRPFQLGEPRLLVAAEKV